MADIPRPEHAAPDVPQANLADLPPGDPQGAVTVGVDGGFQHFAAQVMALDWTALGLAALRVGIVLLVARLAVVLLRRAFATLERRMAARAEEGGAAAAEARKRAETLTRLLRQGAILVTWIIAGLILLGELGINIGPLLASAGIVGLAVGFGAQNLVRDVISGFFIILENQVRVGDVAVVNGTGGLVESINFRTLVLRDQRGAVHVFPNGTITTLSNLTKEWSAYVFDLSVAYKEDTDRVVAVIEEVGAELRADPDFQDHITEDLELMGVDQLADSAVVIRGRIRTQPIKQWLVGREFLRRVKIAFDSAGIEIPFPHRTLYLGETSQPFLVRSESDGHKAQQAPATGEPPRDERSSATG
jgi:moderate conductance mechanosensitive channel